MDRIRIKGGIPLKGKIPVSGAKNAALPLMCACLLSDKPLTLTNIPHLADIATLSNLLGTLGVKLTLKGDHSQEMVLDAGGVNSVEASYELVRKMRASILVLGPLLARFKEAKVSLPGGCAIGARPVDLHLKALEALGAEITIKDGYVLAKAPKGLKGTEYTFPMVSVGATENVMMAAALAKGTTILHNVAREPEIGDIAACLQAMGVKIEGVDTDTLTIHGVKSFKKAKHSVVPDRIEAATYAIAAVMTKGQVTLTGAKADHISAVLQTLREAGAEIKETKTGLQIKAPEKGVQPFKVVTKPHPGFATDVQAQIMALATVAKGTSSITETIFENRFMHVPELARLGADITLNGNTAMVAGGKPLKGAEVMATDLRASVSLVLAGLVAKGSTTISRVYHLDRGYERLEEKLRACGAVIERLKD